MLKIKFKRCGRKKKPFYRIVLMQSLLKRDGKTIEELGFYDPLKKNLHINKERVLIRLKHGAQPTLVVKNLLNTCY
uniref:30S ribosomal protein S16 n=1 Tax=Choristocarpus tenellus TaxID=116065 RepID=UPI002E774A66|nr:30S ribosomal protein S16 [Choristocarpus tenellus]WAM62296.1 30S ribosomal protein S16 [Choristocarpus tenellus]